jgi:protein SCO1
MQRKKVVFLLVGFFLILSSAFFYFVIPYIRASEAKKPLLPIIGSERNHHIMPFSFVDQDGTVFSKEQTVDKICVVEYFFTTCKSICPKMNENMRLVYDAIKDDKQVLILSHTVDPEHDSVSVLKKYSLSFNADPNQWHFLTGNKKKLYELARYGYLINAEQDTAGIAIENDFIHDNHFVLVDGKARIRGYYDGLDVASVKKLIADIKILEREK